MKKSVIITGLCIFLTTLFSCKKDALQPSCGVVTEKIERGGALLVKVRLDNGTTELRDYTTLGQYFYALEVGGRDCK